MPPPPKREAEFLTIDEIRAAPPVAPAGMGTAPGVQPAQPSPPSQPTDSWEVRLATKWLPLIGGVLLLAGAALAAKLILPKLGPWARILAGYCVSVVITGAGVWVTRRHQPLGRATAAIGIALAFFMSFAAHYIPQTRVLGAPAAIGLMLLFTVVIVALAEVWKSEATAAFGLALGALAALLSADVSRQFALIAIGVLALGAGISLVRHEWHRLTTLALAGTYLATLALWFISPVGAAQGEILTHLGALIGYHLVFTAAFWRWGRVWVAREQAAIEAERHDAAPRILLPQVPYSTGFAILNSLGLCAMSIFLFWRTKTLWPNVHVLLFALAAGEAARLAFAGLRRAALASFHSLTAFALAMGGVIAAFSGLTESAVLSAMALALTIAASRAPVLRILRPLTAACAIAAVPSFRPGALATPINMLAALAPPVLLLATGLPWECIWMKRRRAAFSWRLLFRITETISGTLRSLIATGMIFYVLGKWSTGKLPEEVAFGAVAIILVLGIILFRARVWLAPAAISAAFALGMMIDRNMPSPAWIGARLLWVAVAMYLWQDLARQAGSRAWGVLLALVQVAFTAGVLFFAIGAVEPAAPMRGLCLAAGAAAAWAIGTFAFWFPPIPMLVRFPEAEPDNEDADGGVNEEGGALLEAPAPGFGSMHIRLGWMAAVAVGVAAFLFGALADAQKSLFSPAILVGCMAAGWAVFSAFASPRKDSLGAEERFRNAAFYQALLGAGVLLMGGIAMLVFSRVAPWSLLATVALASGVLFAGAWRPGRATALAGFLALIFLPALVMARVLTEKPANGTEEIYLLLACVLFAGMARFLPWIQKRIAERSEEDSLAKGAMPWLIATGAAIALVTLTRGPMIPSSFITVSWGAVGILLLAAGLIWLDRTMRYVAMGVFVAAVGRILLRDLTGVSPLTRAVASLGIGVVLIGAGIAYGILRKRLQK